MTDSTVARAATIMESIGATPADSAPDTSVNELPYPVKYDDLKLSIGDEVVYDDLMRVYESTEEFNAVEQPEYEDSSFDLNSLGVALGTSMSGFDEELFPFLLWTPLESEVGTRMLYLISGDGTIACLDASNKATAEAGIATAIEDIHRTKNTPNLVSEANLPSVNASVKKIDNP